MLLALLESSARRSRRVGSTLVSVLSHFAVIGSAVAVTAGVDRQEISTKTEVVRLVAPPPTPRPAPPRVKAPTADASAAVASIDIPTLPTIDLPAIIPTSIPDLDPGAIRVSSDDRISIGGPPSDALRHGVAGLIDGGDGRSSDLGGEVIMRLDGKPKPPRYPEALRSAGVEGRVLVRFTVDTLGRVELRSVAIVQSTNELFTSAVRSTLGDLRFVPATVRGHKVAAAALMPFEFTIVH